MRKILLFLILLSGCADLYAQERPNIVYILCDDLGYGDVQVLNPDKGKILTPNIDQFAKESMTFTDAHSGSAVCTPSRYGILTGRYSWRSRLQEGVLRGGDEFNPLIDVNRMTVASMLKKEGYSTGAIGKWHLGFQYLNSEGEEYELYENGKLANTPIGATLPNGPISRGFDSFIGFHHSASMETVVRDDKVVAHMQPIEMLQFLTDETTQYIKNHAGKESPFFLYLALNSPHSPVVPSEKWQGKSGMGSYADFVMETDDAVGQVLRALKENGLDDNTLVVFTSDNGTSFPESRALQLKKDFGHYVSADFRGGKSDIWEGGHRIPFMVRWKGKIKANSQSDALICQASFMATCSEITGIELPENAGEDSFSILPILKNESQNSPYEYVVHHSINGKFSIRNSTWKLEFASGSGGWSAPTDEKASAENLTAIQLYNMDEDVEESRNLYDSYPEIVSALTAELEKIVSNGRSTPGQKQPNDVAIDIFKVDR